MVGVATRQAHTLVYPVDGSFVVWNQADWAFFVFVFAFCTGFSGVFENVLPLRGLRLAFFLFFDECLNPGGALLNVDKNAFLLCANVFVFLVFP